MMTLPTPPHTLKKTAGFFKPYTRQTYYEDLYGTRNPDEELDIPDICESDSDSEDEEAVQQNGGGLFKFPSTLDHAHSQQQTITHQEPTDPDGQETQYRIAPHINAKSSVPVASSKTLAPKKFGMFAAYDPLDATVVSAVESGDEDEEAESEIGRLGSRSTDVHGKNDENVSKKTPSRQKRKYNGTRIERPRTRRLISQEIAEHARERKAALRAGDAGSGPAKAAARARPTPKVPVRHQIVSEEFAHADAASNASSKTRREILQKARDARAARRGGNGDKAANAPKEDSFREVGDQEAEELIKRKLWVKVNNSNINVDEY